MLFIVATSLSHISHIDENLFFLKKQNWCQLKNYARFNFTVEQKLNKMNIAGRMPEIIRNSFVDLQSQNVSKRNRQKNFFLLNAMLYFD